MEKKLWGGRFKKKQDKEFEKFSRSIHFDSRLARYDIYHSLIHTIALGNAGVLSSREMEKILLGLLEIMEEINKGKFKPSRTAEDIHTEIQNQLFRKIGDLAYKLHTFRSRNEQIVFDEKFFCINEGVTILRLLVSLMESLWIFAEKYKKEPFLGYTHTQRAQVIYFYEYPMAYYSMFSRDCQRIDNFLRRMVIYVGSGALAGSPIKPGAYKKALSEFVKKFNIDYLKIKVVENSLDNVSSRDFLIEFLSFLAIIQTNLSRLAEDFILYSTSEFNFFMLPEEFSTGSSLMPQKMNPDFLELVRGYSGFLYGALVSLFTVLKGLPLTYNRDMQLDKEPLFSSVDVVKKELELFSEFVRRVELNKEAIRRALEDESLYATELAFYLVEKGQDFRTAHNIAGRLIRHSKETGVKIKDMSSEILKSFSPELENKVVKKIINPQFALKFKKLNPRKIPDFKTRGVYGLF